MCTNYDEHRMCPYENKWSENAHLRLKIILILFITWMAFIVDNYYFNKTDTFATLEQKLTIDTVCKIGPISIT